MFVGTFWISHESFLLLERAINLDFVWWLEKQSMKLIVSKSTWQIERTEKFYAGFYVLVILKWRWKWIEKLHPKFKNLPLSLIKLNPSATRNSILHTTHSLTWKRKLHFWIITTFSQVWSDLKIGCNVTNSVWETFTFIVKSESHCHLEKKRMKMQLEHHSVFFTEFLFKFQKTWKFFRKPGKFGNLRKPEKTFNFRKPGKLWNFRKFFLKIQKIL